MNSFQWTDDTVAEFARFVQEKKNASTVWTNDLTAEKSCISDFISSKGPLMFITDDDVSIEVKDGNKFWLVYNFRATEAVFSGGTHIHKLYEKRPEFKYFSTEERANNYILSHKPCLTFWDICTIFKIEDTQREKLIKIIDSRQPFKNI